ncbi:MAG: addiction module protein [Desulfobacteraceae bacterium]|nr:addiction module protein [Desulfobacteraceae bacterium]
MNFNLKEMSTEEKLRAMEMLWDDICRNVPDFLSPAWHENILKEREKKLKEGKDRFVDWDHAKKDIWNSVS